MLILRDIVERDIEDYVRWFTTETEWGNWDAPWEPFDEDEAAYRAQWTEYYEKVSSYAPDAFRWRYEVEYDGVHIGWICSYTDLGYMENPNEYPALGLSFPDPSLRGKGIGAEVIKQFIAQFRKNGIHHFYTQTWSGNLRMMRLAEKLGFKEVCRMKNYREVDGVFYDAVTFYLDCTTDA